MIFTPNHLAVTRFMALLDDAKWSVYLGDKDKDEAATRQDLADALNFRDPIKGWDHLSGKWNRSSEHEWNDAYNVALMSEYISIEYVKYKITDAVEEQKWGEARHWLKVMEFGE